MLIIVGTGRSGTVYLAKSMKQVYQIGMSAEPRFVYVDFKKHFHRVNYHNEDEVREALRRIYNNRFFWHLRERKKLETSFDEMCRIVQPGKVRNYGEMITGVFKYVAMVRSATFPGYKDPLDVHHIRELSEIIPNARFIHIIRDGRDVASSMLKFNWGPTNLYRGARLWSRGVNKGIVEGRKLPDDRYLEIRYEDLVREPARTAEAIDDFVYPIVHESHREELVQYFQKTLRADGLQKWRSALSSDEISLLNGTLQGDLERLGYQVDEPGKKISLPHELYYTLSDLTMRAINKMVRPKKRSMKEQKKITNQT